jgi:cellulose synthase operon protein C
VTRAILIVFLMAGAPALAQYRPPPPTESAQLTRDGDNERADAAKKDAAGDRQGAAALYVKAIEKYEKALTLDADNVEAATGLGAACVARRDYARAVKGLTAFNKAHPDAGEVAFSLGLSLFKLNKFAEALPLLEPLAKADAPEHFMSHYYLGSYALQQKDSARAVEELQLFLKRRPGELAGGDSQIEEMIGRAHLVGRKPVEARAAFERAYKIKPTSNAQLGIAAALDMQGKSGEALSLVEGLAKRDAKNPDVVDRLARMYLTRGQLPRAAEVAVELVRIAKSAPSLILLGDVRAAQKDWKAAVDQYREAVKLQPRATAPILGLARGLEQLGRYDEAITELERTAGDGDPAILAALGSGHRRAGHYQKALEIHTKLLKQMGKDAQSHILLGADHFAVGQFDEAISDYSAALEIDPGNARARHCLALALQRRAQLRALNTKLTEAAMFDLRRAYDLEPTESLAQWLAAISLSQQKYADAEQTLSTRATAANAAWQSQLLYAYALLGSGKAKEALPLFDKITAAEAQSAVDLGWALAKLQLEESEAAVKRLSSAKNLSATAQANLPLILLKLAWTKLTEGDIAGAAREIAQVGATPKGTAVHKLGELVKALIALENKSYAPAMAGIKSALGERQPWFEPAARPLFEAYVEYRMGKPADARKQLALAVKAAGANKLPFAAKLARAIDEREAELLYAQNAAGARPRIEKLLGAGADARTQNNVACARYRQGGQAQAVATWKTLAPKLPEAELNLGLHALQQERDARGALTRFKRYIAAGGGRAPQAREWVERLSQLYGEEAGK